MALALSSNGFAWSCDAQPFVLHLKRWAHTNQKNKNDRYYFCFQILLMKKEINPAELDFLLRFPVAQNATCPVDFLTTVGWGAIKILSSMDEFRNLDRDIETNAKRWKKFVEAECPEKVQLKKERL